MRQVPEPEHSEWVRRLRERARLDAEQLVPHPRFAVLGLSAPALRPAALASFGQVNDELESVTLAYGDWSALAGPHITVTSAVVRAGEAQLPGHVARNELLRAIDTDRNRIADHAGIDDDEPPQAPAYSRALLPCGEALVCRHGNVWAARLLPAPPPLAAPGAYPAASPLVTVTITGRGVEPDSVSVEPAGDLRPYFEARNEILGQLTQRHRQQPPPVLEPAEGIAAFRALADHTLGGQDRLRRSLRDGRVPRHRAGEGAVRSALWQRAVSEQQRVGGMDKHAADDVVTLAINHLGHLAERAPWFTDPRLRELAIDETLRHAMLGDDVPSIAAQRAWAWYWDVQTSRWRRQQEPDGGLADMRASRAADSAWLEAWAAWTLNIRP